MRNSDIEGVILGEGSPKIIVPITPRSLRELEEQALALGGQLLEDRKGRALAFETGGREGTPPHFNADLLEWRVDHFEESGVDLLHAAAILRARTPLPIIATFRTRAEGGERDIDTAAYSKLVQSLASSGSIAAVDVELSRGPEVLSQIIRAAHNSGVEVITSAHFFTSTPPREAIVSLLSDMAAAGADVAKVACMPQTPGDTLTLLQATWDASEQLDIPIITMAMGPVGAVSRVVGGLFGSAATFATVGAASAPGQIPAADLVPLLEALQEFAKRG